METSIWTGIDWFNLLQTVALLFGLCATTSTLRQETRSRKLSSILSLTANHREIWMALINNSKLGRVLDQEADLTVAPPTMEEEVFVQMLILQIRSAIIARKLGIGVADENIEADIADLFRLQIPRAVWKATRKYHGKDVQLIIDEAIRSGGAQRDNQTESQ